MGVWNWISAALELPLSRPQRRRMGEREGYRREDFVRHFGREPDIAEEIWSALSAVAVVPGFKPMPRDDLLEVFRLAEEDLDEVVLRILQRCGCRVPSVAETGSMKPLRTVADLFDFVGAMRGGERRP